MSQSAPAGEYPWNDSPIAEPAFRQELRELPPSAKLVAQILALEAPLAQVEVAERALLSEKTARYALGRLEEVGLASCRTRLDDARKREYVLTTNVDAGVETDEFETDEFETD